MDSVEQETKEEILFRARTKHEAFDQIYGFFSSPPPIFLGDFGATKAGAISVNVASINAGLLSLPPLLSKQKRD